MEYTIKNLSKSEIEITITVPEEKMHESRKKACDELSKDVKIKGFRPGHVPPKVLEDYLGKKHIDLHANEMAIQMAYSEIVVKDKLQVLTRPTINIESLEPLTFKATVAIMPEIELKDYKSIKIKKEEAKVSKEDVDKVIEDMKKHGTTYTDVDRAAKIGDRVEVDFEGFEGDKAVPNTKSENHPVILGGESLIPGFEDEIVGLKTGENKEFDINFPKDYHKKDFQNKKMKFKVAVKRVEEAKEGELNEALIEKLTGKKHTIEEFKKNLEENILARKKQELSQKRENEYIEKLLKQTKVDLPKSLVEEEAEHILLEMKEDIQAKKLEWDQFLERAKTTEDKLREKYKTEAERRIKVRLAIGHIIKEEKIEVTLEEVIAELEKVKAFYPAEQHDKIQEDFERGNLETSIRNRMLIRKLFDKVLV